MTQTWNCGLLLKSGLVMASLLTGCAGETANSEGGELPSDEGQQLASGQSGNEGSSLRLPCFYESSTVLVVEVTSTAGGCFAAEVLEVVQDSTAESLSVGDVVGGMPSLFYTSTQPQEGDTVTIQYFRGEGEQAALSGSAQVSPMEDGKVQLEWLGETYAYTHAELLAESCDEMILALPNLLPAEEPGGEDPDDGAPPPEAPPLSCPPE